MKISKKIMVLSLAASIALSPIVVSAKVEKEASEISPISTVVINEEETLIPEYIKYRGKIVEIIEGDKSNSILVKDNEEDEYNGQVYHLNEKVSILDAKTKEILDKEALKEGMEVTTFSHKDTPVAQSLPAQSSPNIILINGGEDTGFVEVSKFDEKLVNVENTLKLIIGDETLLVNEDGGKVEKADLKNRDLIVFYSISTRSIPAQTSPEKIIVLNEEDLLEELEEIRVIDKLIINEKEVVLDKELYSKDEIPMIPLRQISEALGYKVTWNNESRTAELTKGAQWTSVKIGEDNYSFAKMIVKLGAAPELKEGTTFVPIGFLEEVLKINVEITKEGTIKIGE